MTTENNKKEKEGEIKSKEIDRGVEKAAEESTSENFNTTDLIMTFNDKIKNLTTIELLVLFVNKAGTVYTQHKAELIKEELRKNRLTESQYLPLTIAHSHFVIGEGREELDKVCNELIKVIQSKK